MGIVGAIVITKWALNLIRRSGGVLLDKCDDDELEKEVRAIIEANTDNRLSDLHLWQVGPGHWAAIVSVVTNAPLPPQHYRNLLSGIHELSHVTIEIHANN
jgi:Co/Zn/Cd efflux system component